MPAWPSTALLLADVVLLIHLAFVLFVLFGGLLGWRWRRIFWGTFVEFSGWICPLTPLENWLRKKGSGTGYDGDFVGQYLLMLLYPDDLSRTAQLVLGIIVIAMNLAVYGWLWQRGRILRSKKESAE